MKRQTGKLKVILKFAIVIGALGFYAVAQAQVPVGLKVNGNKLEVTTRGACASAPDELGCVEAHGVTRINFQMNASPGGSLQHVALNSGFPPQAAIDFNADPGTGIITPKNQSVNHIMIEDRNTAAYTVNYTVTAICNGNQIDSDPRVINDGTGTP